MTQRQSARSPALTELDCTKEEPHVPPPEIKPWCPFIVVGQIEPANRHERARYPPDAECEECDFTGEDEKSPIEFDIYFDIYAES